MMEKYDELRTKAAALLRTRGPSDKSLYERDLTSLVEELSIYQIELEHQNASLMEAQEDLLAAKERYTDLFDKAPIGYVILDKSHGIQEINNTASTMLNVGSGDLVDSKFTSLIDPEYQDTFYFYFKTCSTNSGNSSCDLKLKKKQHGPFFARLIIIPEKEKEPENRLFRMAIMDISAEKEMEQRLLAETEKAKQSDRLKSAFLANMSHEIRTPLNGILGFASLLAEGGNSPNEVQRFSEIILQGGDRLLALINNILDISKIESGNMTLSVSDCSPSQLIDEVMALFQVSALKKGNLMKKRVDPLDESLKFSSDPAKISQVLANLVSNAIKFTGDGIIEIGFCRRNGYIEFEVRDTGCGIPEEEHRLIFSRFYQAENILVAEGEGTGLGLSVSKALVELMQGKISFESVAGSGTVFRFLLPFTEVPDQQVPELETIHAPVSNFNDQLKVLLVEDEDDSAEYMSLLLKSLNVSFVLARNGAEALNMVEMHNSISLVFMDIRLPLMNGYEAMRRIRSKRPELKIVALTAFALESDRRKAFEAGCDDFISKPVSRTDLLKVISRPLFLTRT